MPDLKTQVFEALDTATKENDFSYFGMTPLEVADDIVEFNATFENVQPEELVPHIEAWLEGNPQEDK
jgi:hypothetical protein